jgi:catechol 2,3-dioxygenase-like lactoylglutathione lyase family enzyme
VFKRVDHIEIVTDRASETERFYTEILGFRVRARDHIERPGAGGLDLTYLDLGGTTVELIAFHGVAVASEPEREHLGYRMMALEVADMNAVAAYLKTKGVEIVWGPVVRDAYARAEICDPNGFRIELRQWFAASATASADD